MKRRNFLGGLLALPVAVKSMPEKLDVKNPETVIDKSEFEHLEDLNNLYLNRDFFDYITENPPKFKWKKMHDSIGYRFFKVKTRLELLPELNYYEMSYNKRIKFIKEIVKDLGRVIDSSVSVTFYSLEFTPRLYNPENFVPFQMALIRYEVDK